MDLTIFRPDGWNAKGALSSDIFVGTMSLERIKERSVHVFTKSFRITESASLALRMHRADGSSPCNLDRLKV